MIQEKGFKNQFERQEDKGIINQEKFPTSAEYIEKLKEFGSEKHIEAYNKVLDIAQSVKESDGRALLVGGSIRDAIWGQVSKDFDLEIYKLKAEKVEEITKKFGIVSDVGRAFGILKLFTEKGIDIDISLPRTDSKIAIGHKGFEIKTNPDMTIEEAARRRDFTINSMAADPLTGELFDPFRGLKDLRGRKLRITDHERFRDDPLRVMRALQFISRFGLELNHDDIPVIQEMIPLLKELPKERIFEEWKKLLLKSEKPSLGLVAGMALGVFKEIHPEFPPLAETPQEPEWHPEGDVWIHTLMSVDESAKIAKREEIVDDKALTLLISTLCHDLGKPIVTKFKNGRYVSHSHEQFGEEPTKKFLTGVGVDGLTRKKVIKLITNHMAPTLLYVSEVVKKQKVSDGAIRRLAAKIHPATIQELVMVAEADHLGRGPFQYPEIPEQLFMPKEFPAKEWLLKRARKLEVEKSRPANLTRGRDWLNLGYEQSMEIGKLIRLSNDLRDEKNFTREAVFQSIDGINNMNEVLAKLENLRKEKGQ